MLENKMSLKHIQIIRRAKLILQSANIFFWRDGNFFSRLKSYWDANATINFFSNEAFKALNNKKNSGVVLHRENHTCKRIKNYKINVEARRKMLYYGSFANVCVYTRVCLCAQLCACVCVHACVFFQDCCFSQQSTILSSTMLVSGN